MHQGASVFYLPSDGRDWAKYVASKLEEYNIKCKMFDFKDTKTFDISSHVNVFIVTPDFLEFTDWTVFKHVDINKCILILTGSEQCDLEEASRRYGCEQVADCTMHENTGSEECVKEMMIRIILMYEGELHTSSPAHTSPAPEPHSFYHSPSDTGPDRDSGDYAVLPAYTRQVNCLHEVFYKGNTLYVVVDREAEGKLEIDMGGSKLEPTFSEYAVYTVQLPKTQTDPTACAVTVYQDERTIGKSNVSRLYNDHKQAFDADVDESKRRLASLHSSVADQSNSLVSVSSQTDFVVNASESFSDNDNVFIENVRKKSDVNGNREQSGENVDFNVKDENQRDTLKADDESFESDKLEVLRQLLEEATAPEQLLCQCFGIEDSDCALLDEKMTSLIESANAFPGLTYPVNNEEFYQSVWPTLLHFGARFNLVKFCDALLSNPMMYDVVNRRNKDGHRPVDIARTHDHFELANMLESFAYKLLTSRENKYDSGVSGISFESSRISIRLMSEKDTPVLPPKDTPVLPPKPHTFQRHYGYAKIAGETGGDGIPIIVTPGDFNEIDAKTMCPVGYRDSEIKSNKSLTDQSPTCSPVSVEVGSSSDDVSAYVRYHRKDLSALLGMTTPPQPRKKKPGGLSKLIGRMRGGSRSETPSPKLKQAKGGRRYTRVDSKRSSGTSSSTASVHSDISQRDEDFGPVLRKSDLNTDKSGGNLLGIVSNAKVRKSMRVSKALKDQHRDGPSLPVKRLAAEGEVF